MIDKKDLRDGLKGMSPRSTVSKDAFWARFASRARAEAPAQESAGWFWLLHTGTVRWSLGSLAGFAMVALLLLASGPKVEAGVGVVQTLEIHAPYDSVMILQATEEEGTLVWIDGI